MAEKQAVVEKQHLVGDIRIVGPVRPLGRKWLPQLTYTSFLVVKTDKEPVWVNEDNDDERGEYKWVQGAFADDLAFAARSSFVEGFDLLGEGVLEVEAGCAPMGWCFARVRPHDAIAGLTHFAVGAISIGSGNLEWKQEDWDRIAANLEYDSVRIVMMIGERDIRDCGERLASTCLDKDMKAEHMGGLSMAQCSCCCWVFRLVLTSTSSLQPR